MVEQTPGIAAKPAIPTGAMAAPASRAERRRAALRPRLLVVAGGLRARPDLLRSTALQAVFLAGLAVPGGQAAAQTAPAATALPTGGQVIAGQAKIATTTGPGTAAMTVTQATKYGAYDWKSFDIGKSASVAYQVPNSQSISVNRVISPTSPSVIAGKLSSNGVLVVQNQSGVVFTQGAEVNVSTLIASAPGISDVNARAGKLVFDQPAHPGARVENHGTITVAQTGLAALVAPQVANSGVIRAQMGRVVLAGAEAHTIDLYGDGLLSIDVTKQVTQAPVGPDGKTATALVTNSGTIIADGGTILLTASAVDGLVQTLVTSGGTVRADTVATSAGGTTAGRIAVTAKGGNVVVTGTVAARGVTAGSRGGQIEINAPARSVTLKAGAKVDASGRAGGGSIAVGTTMARAKAGPGTAAPTARNVRIESGARVAADATQSGKGGDITVLSQGGVSEHRGELSARGGPEGGDGGFIELSGSRFVVGGRIDTGAPLGVSGSILLDPFDLVISDAGTTKIKNNSDTFKTEVEDSATVISPAEIRDNMTGAITLLTDKGGTLTVSSALDLTAKNSKGDATGITSLTLQSDGNMSINAAVTGGDNITLLNTAGSLSIAAPVTTADGKTITLNSAGSIALGAAVSAGTTGILDITAGAGGVTQTAGSIVAGTLRSTGGIAGGATLNQATNNVVTLGAITATVGNLSLATTAALKVDGAVKVDGGKSVAIAAPALTYGAAGSIATGSGTFAFAPLAGAMTLDATTAAALSKVTAATIQLGQAAGVTATAVTLADSLDTSGFATTNIVAGAGGFVLTNGTLKAAILDVTAGGGIADSATGSLAVATLRSSGGIGGNVLLNTVDHAIGTLGGLVATGGGIALKSSAALGVTGTVKADSIELQSSFSGSAKAVEVSATGALVVAGGTIALQSAGDSGITLTGTIDAGSKGSLALAAGSKGVTQDGGSIAAGQVRGAVAGAASLVQGGNAIAAIGKFEAAGDFTLVTGTAVTVGDALSAANVAIASSAASGSAIAVAAAGSITANGAGGTVTLAASDAGAGGIALAGDVAAKTGAIDLSAGAGGVLQTIGSLTTPSLRSTGGIGGTASLTSATNAIDGTGTIAVTGGDLLLASATTLDVAGVLSVEANRTLSLGIDGLKLDTGSLSAAGGTVEIAPLTAGGAMSLGKAAAAELTLPTAALGKISSATLRLGGAKASATVADSLFVREGFDASGAATATLRLDAGANGITIDSAVVLKANTLDLNSAGGVASIAGAKVAAARLQSTGGITGDATLAEPGNAIATLGDMTITGGSLVLSSTLALDIAGKVSADSATIASSAASGKAIGVTGQLLAGKGGMLSLTAGNAAGGIAISGAVDASATGKLELASGTGGIVQSGGTVAAGTLAGTTLGALTLAEAGNQFATIGDVTATGDAMVASSVAMKLAGTLSAANVTLTGSLDAAGALDIAGTVKAVGIAAFAASGKAGGIALSGTVDATTIDFAAGLGGVVQSGGSLVAGTVRSGAIAGALALDSATNKIASLGKVTLTGAGDLSVTSAVALKVGDSVQVGDGRAVTLTTTAAGTLTVAAPITASGGSVALRATDTDGGIALAATVDTGAKGSLDLVAGSLGITQTAGGLVTGALGSSASVGGTTTLGGPDNSIATIGTFTVDTGGFSLASTGALSVAGALSAPTGTVRLDIKATDGTAIAIPGTVSAANVTLVGSGTGGGIAIGGGVATPGILDISSAGGAGVAASGSLVAGSLASKFGIAGGFDARGDNAIGSIDAITVTGGNFAIANKSGAALAVKGAIVVDAAQTIRIEADEATITGALTAPGGTVTLLAPTSGISLGLEVAGSLSVLQAGVDQITAATLDLVASKGAITLGDSLNASGIPTLRLDAGVGIALDKGTLTASRLEVAVASGGIAQGGGGLLSAKVLTSGAGTVAGAIALGAGGNAIATLDQLAATGAITIASATALDVAGAVGASDIALTGGFAGTALTLSAGGSLAAPGAISLTAGNAAGGMTLAGSVTAATLQLAAGTGGVVQTGGQITAGTLTAPLVLGSTTLASAANAIATLGAFQAVGDLTLVSSVPLAATGTVSAANLSLSSAGALALSGDLLAAGTLALGAGGSITQSAGSLGAGTLVTIGEITGAIDLKQANGIAALGAISATDGITIVSNQAFAVTGEVRAGDGKTLSLAAPGMSFAGAGALTAKGGTVEIGPVDGTSTFGLGTGAVAQDFVLGSLANVTAELVRIGQASSAGNASKAAGIVLDGTVAPAAQTLELVSSGTITQDKGGLIIPVLTATALSLDLSQPGNSIKALGPLAITGSLAIATDTAITVGGTLKAASITLDSAAAGSGAIDIGGSLATDDGGTITLRASNATGGIALSGTLDATKTGIVDLTAGSGGIAQSGGSIAAGTLRSSGATTGAVSLDQAANAIATLGNFAVNGGGLTLRTGGDLSVSGAVSAGDIAVRSVSGSLALDAAGSLAAAGTVLLDATAKAGGIELGGAVSANLLDLSAGTGGIVQTGGTIVATALQSSGGSTGVVALGETANKIDVLGKFIVTGADFTLVDLAALTVAGPVSAGNVTLRGDAKLATAVNVTGSIATDGGTITLAATNADGGIALSGTLAAAKGTVDLSAGSLGISQTGGSIAAGTLRSATGSTGAVSLQQPANDIGALGNFSVTGKSFALTNGGALTVKGTVDAVGITLASDAAGIAVEAGASLAAGTGTLALLAADGGLSLGGTLGGAAVELVAGGGGIVQPGGSIAATTLRAIVTGGGNATLGQAGNSIATLGDTTVAGALTLVDATPLTVAGAVKADSITLTTSGATLALDAAGSLATAGGTIALGAANGAIALDGKIDATAAGALELSAGGNVTQGGGTITAGTLRGGAAATDIGGTLTLAQPANAIGMIGALAVKGDATIASATPLDIAGPFSAADMLVTGTAAGAQALSVSGTATAVGTMTLVAGPAGGIALSGTLAATTLDLTAGSAGIAQAGGSITAGTLRSSGGSAGAVSLDQAGNAIGALGPFEVTGESFTLRDSAALDITGAVSASAITIRTTTAALNLATTGSLAAPGTALLAAPAAGIVLAGTVDAGVLDMSAGKDGIRQTGGTIAAGTLRSSDGSAGPVELDLDGNKIGALGAFAVTNGAFTLRDGIALDIVGAVSAPDITIRNTGATITLDIAGSLVATGTALLDATKAGIVLKGSVDADVLDLAAATGVQQTGGSITAGTLRSTGTLGGPVALTQAANKIATLGDFVVSGGTLSLTDSLALNVAGAVKASDITLVDTVAGTAITVTGSLATADGGTLLLQAAHAAGGLSLAGSLNSGVLDLRAGTGGVAQPAGSITANVLRTTVSGGSATLGQASNSIAILGDSTITGGSLSLANSAPLLVLGTVAADAITITDSAPSGAITVSGSLVTTAGGTITLVASNAIGEISLNSFINASATGTVDLSAGGLVSQSTGSITAGTLRSTGGIGGTLVLTQGNSIGRIDNLAVAGVASIVSIIPLDIAGAFSGATGIELVGTAAGTALTVSGSAATSGVMTLTAGDLAGDILLSGNVTADTLLLNAGTGGIAQSAGSITAATLLSSTGSKGAVTLTQTGNAIATLGAFDASGSLFQLQSKSALTVAGPVTASNVSIASSAAATKAIDVTGSIASGMLFLAAKDPSGGVALSGSVVSSGIASLTAGSGGVVQSGGTLAANVLSASAAGGSVVLTQPGNTVVDLFPSGATGGDFNLVTATGFTANGVVADNVSLRALSGDITTKLGGIATNGAGLIVLDAAGAIGLAGPLNADGGIVDLIAKNGVAQTTSGAITAGTLRSSGGIVGDVQLDKAANAVVAIADLSASGNFALVDATALTVAGTLSAANVTLVDTADAAAAIAIPGTVRSGAGGTIALAATGASSGIALAGTVDATPTGLVDVMAGSGGVAQSAGAITTGMLQSNNGVGGTVALDQPGNAIGTLGTLTVQSGNLSLTSSRALTVSGPVAVAAGDVALTGSAAGPLALSLTGPVAASGTVRLAATAPDGGIVLAGALKATTLDLSAGTGGVAQTAGALELGVLRASGLNGTVSLAQPLNTIGTIADFITATGDITLANATPLTVAGTLQATNGNVALTGFAASPAAIAVTGMVASGGDMTIDTPGGGLAVLASGQLAAPNGTMVLTSAAGIAAPGKISAGTLAVTAALNTADVALTGANAIGTLAGASLAGGSFTLKNAVPLTISGPVSAPLIAITATESLVVKDGVVITTNGIGRAAQGLGGKLSDGEINSFSGHTAGSFLEVTSAAGAASIATGNIAVLPFSAALATLDLVVTSPQPGTVKIGQLKGATTDLILVTRIGGISTGTVDVAGLLVVGGGGKTDLFGKVGGLDGQAAANKAHIAPRPSADYRFNACPITSVNCMLIPIQTIPPTSPLRDVPFIRDRPTQDDTDVQLPNVSDEDY